MIKAYIIHSSDSVQRRAHMEAELKGRDIDAEFVVEGDKKDLSPMILSTYFRGEMAAASAAASCVYKHLLACRRVAEGRDDVALILEDDISFYRNFDGHITGVLAEIRERGIESFIVSLEDSLLRYVDGSRRVKGTLLYRADSGRCAGAYLIDKKGAAAILEKALRDKTDIPVDWFHNWCADEGIITIYWSHPTICCQGSLDGSIRSLLDNKEHGLLRRISFRLQRLCKQAFYGMR